MLRLRKSKSCNSTCSTTFCSKAASPCAWLENLFVQKQAQTVDQSRSAQNAAAAIEQMVNTGAVSRGQFGQVAVPAVAEVAPVQSNNAYISQSPVKQDVREHVEKDDKSQQQRQNNKSVNIKSNVNNINNHMNSNIKFMKKWFNCHAKNNVS